MAGITERNRMKTDLAGLGYSLKYIDEWQPKTRLYRHKPSYNTQGDIVRKVGTFIDNVPGNPDYVQRKARIGLFAWAPSDECTCRWCTENTVKNLATKCDECDFEPKGETPSAKALSLKMHTYHRHKEAVVSA